MYIYVYIYIYKTSNKVTEFFIRKFIEHREHYIENRALRFSLYFFSLTRGLNSRNRIIRANIGNFKCTEMDGKWMILTVPRVCRANV